MKRIKNHSDKEIIILSERFHPDTTSATGQYMTDIAIGLQQRGLDVTVITRQMCSDRARAEQDRLESTDVTIHRIPIPSLKRDNLLKRLYNWITYIFIVILMLMVDQPDEDRELVFVSYPTIMPPFAWFVCKIRGWDYMYIVHDYHPEAAVELGYIKQDSVIHRVWRKINQHILLDAAHIVALGPKMEDQIIDSVDEKYSDEFNESKISVIHNWADGEYIQPKRKDHNWFSQKYGLDKRFSLIYSGNIGEFHDLETLIKGVAGMDSDEVRALIIGEGDNKQNIIDLANSIGVLGDIVEILPYQPWSTVPYSLTAGDVSVVAVNPGFKGLCVSSKLYTALAAGQPILVIAEEDSDESEIVQRFDAGIQVSPGDQQGIADAINEWKQNPQLVMKQGKNAREAFENKFSRENSIDSYYELLVEGHEYN